VSGPVQVFEGVVISGTLAEVADYDGDRGSQGLSLKHAGKQFRFVSFVSGG
jgi:hypothetical protein